MLLSASSKKRAIKEQHLLSGVCESRFGALFESTKGKLFLQGNITFVENYLTLNALLPQSAVVKKHSRVAAKPRQLWGCNTLSLQYLAASLVKVVCSLLFEVVFLFPWEAANLFLLVLRIAVRGNASNCTKTVAACPGTPASAHVRWRLHDDGCWERIVRWLPWLRGQSESKVAFQEQKTWCLEKVTEENQIC